MTDPATLTALHGETAGDFEGFYQAHFGDTVAMVYTFTADLPEAQDIAQEAFARAWQRWKQVSVYENPVAWVRRVAFNLAHTRWRRLKVAAAFLRKQRIDDVPAVSPNHVAVVAALRKLPKAQREAIVLHYIADLPVDVVALELDVPVGTVKSWLHRGRAAMAHDLVIDIEGSVKTPPAGDVVKRAKKNRRVRNAVVATVLLLVLIGALAAVELFRPHKRDVPIVPTPTPNSVPTPSPTPATVDPTDPILSVDWANSKITFTAARTGCPSGDVQFRPTEFEGNWGPAGAWPKASFLPRAVAYGDLTGDGKAEAVINMTCNIDEDNFLPRRPMLVSRSADGTLRQLAWLPSADAERGFWIADGLLHMDEPSASPLGVVETYRWTGTTFVPSGPASGYSAINGVDLAPVAGKLPCGGKLTLLPADRQGQIYFELGRRGRPYALLAMECSQVSDITFVLADRVDGQWRALDAVTPKLSDREYTPTANENEIDLSGATYVWDGKELRRNG